MIRKNDSDNIPNGPAWAAILASGIGCLALGFFIVLGERTTYFGKLLNLYNPVGNLSGKSSAAILVWLVAWAILHVRWRHRDLTNTGKIMTLTIALVILGVLASCPLVFDMFSAT